MNWYNKPTIMTQFASVVDTVFIGKLKADSWEVAVAVSASMYSFGLYSNS